MSFAFVCRAPAPEEEQERQPRPGHRIGKASPSRLGKRCLRRLRGSSYIGTWKTGLRVQTKCLKQSVRAIACVHGVRPRRFLKPIAEPPGPQSLRQARAKESPLDQGNKLAQGGWPNAGCRVTRATSMFISSSTPKRRTEGGAACPGPPCRVRQYNASATHRSNRCHAHSVFLWCRQQRLAAVGHLISARRRTLNARERPEGDFRT